MKILVPYFGQLNVHGSFKDHTLFIESLLSAVGLTCFAAAPTELSLDTVQDSVCRAENRTWGLQNRVTVVLTSTPYLFRLTERTGLSVCL